ncbi:MAG: hypothetical protein LUH22_12210 [Bacteroides sp.]|nr:hypothetical protein [Bacteroides sp.]
MKTFIKYILVAAAMVMTGCSDDDEQIIYEQPGSMKLVFNQESIFQGKMQTGNLLGINGKGYPILSNGLVAMHDVPAESEYLIYYPADMQFSGKTLKYTLPATQNFSKGAVDMLASPVFCLTDNDGLKEVELSTLCGGLKLTIPANEDFASVTSVVLTAKGDALTGDITLDAETGQMTLGSNTAQTLTLEGNIEIIEDEEVIFALPPLTFTDIVDVTLVSPKGQGTCSIDLKGKAVECGKLLSVTLDNIEWISITNYYGTANSIIVAPGTTTVTVDCAPYYTTSLQYAYENLPGSSTQLARSAKLLWSDVSSNFVSGVSLSADRKSFTATLNGQPGNAVIAIYNVDDPDETEEGEEAIILWSYHIWVTEVNEQNYGINSKGNNYTVLDRNLGATSITPGDSRTIGLVYQWGRKDPFVTNGIVGGNTSAVMYNESGEIDFSIVSGGATNGTVEFSIKNPRSFIKNSRSSSNVTTLPYYYSYDWLYWGNNAIWGNPEGYNYPLATTIQKSVYDPCPAGYCVAPRDTWFNNSGEAGVGPAASIFLSSDALDAANYGYAATYNNQTLWYPFTGLRGRRDGKLTEGDKSGSYWSSSAFAEKGADASYMIVNSSGAIDVAKKSSRGSAFAIRCVKEN